VPVEAIVVASATVLPALAPAVPVFNKGLGIASDAKQP
jgi:hypothetical protein